MSDALVLRDDLSMHGSVENIVTHEPTLWARTKVMFSHDDVGYDKNGIAHFIRKIPTGVSSLGETIFRAVKVKPEHEEENTVPIGGCQLAMEMLFGVKGPLNVPTLYSENGIGYADTAGSTEEGATGNGNKYPTPDGKEKTALYKPGYLVQLFGVGITGTAENDIAVYPVGYREKSINLSIVSKDGLKLDGHMIPFRHVSTGLTEAEKKVYFGRKKENGKTSYYLKKFESEPTIKHIWKTGDEVDMDKETVVTEEEVWSNASTESKNAIESFTQFVLKINEQDVKEWFAAKGESERTRINTIALFTGLYSKTGKYKEENDAEQSDTTNNGGDYQDVRLFSKLNINPEFLTNSKDLNIIYRVYTS